MRLSPPILHDLSPVIDPDLRLIATSPPVSRLVDGVRLLDPTEIDQDRMALSFVHGYGS